ncbi:MAG: right-handed parallel beta-helix repeat-containing protein [Planctomycetota bacterium]
MFKALLFPFLSLFFFLSLIGNTIYVPTDFVTIQEAIDAAENGDIVRVEPGTYNENILFNGKLITVQSMAGPDVTEIKNPNESPGMAAVQFINGENDQAILDGFSITKTFACNNIGIKCISASPKIINNRIWNFGIIGGTLSYGAAIRLKDSNAVIENNLIEKNISSNQAGQGFGAGICCYGTGSPTIINNIIRKNYITSSPYSYHGPSCGAGIASLEEASPLIMNNIIEENVNDYDCQVIGKKAKGGGVYIGGSGAVMFVNNIIRANRAEIEGIVLYADIFGAGIFCENSNAKIQNCVVYENIAVVQTSGFRAKGGGIGITGDCEVVNTIVWGNEATTSDDQIYIYYSGNPLIRNCCVQDGWPNGEAIIAQDPQFDFTDHSRSAFNLTPLSPCINRGTNDVTLSDDYDGDTRPNMGTIDIGIDEYTGPHALSATEFTLSESTGGIIDMTLDAGVENAGRIYLVLAGITATNPGYILPGGQTYIPINWDVMTDLGLILLNTPYMTGFLGYLDPAGQAQAQFDTRGPLDRGVWAGQTLSFAYCLGWPWEFASNPVNVLIVP